MAILKDILDQVTFDEVWSIISQEDSRTDTAEYKETFSGIFSELRAAAPAENRQQMSIRFVMEEAPEWEFWFDNDEPEASEAAEGEETEPAEAAEETEAPEEEEAEEEEAGPTLQVYGFIPGDDEGYAIGMKQPAAIVGLDVDPETLRDYTPAQIAAYCLSEMVYTSTVATSAYGTDKDKAGGGLLASQVCMQEDIQNVDLDALRRELGAIPEHEDYKSKYGFLF